MGCDLAQRTERDVPVVQPLDAPAIITIWANPDAYLERYSRSDKQATGLGQGMEMWGTPYWLVDSSFAAMVLQLAAINEGLGVLLFRNVRQSLESRKGDWGPCRTSACWHRSSWLADPSGEQPGRSANEVRRPTEGGMEAVVHRGGW